MKNQLFASGLCLFLGILTSSCSDSGNKAAKKTPREISHVGENQVKLDTLLTGQKDTVNFFLALEPVPYHFVVAREETPEFVNMHLFEDLQLQIRADQDTFFIRKDDLLEWVNQEYLNEALILHPEVMILDPDNAHYYFEFTTRKPLERFQFRFQSEIRDGLLFTTIIDE